MARDPFTTEATSVAEGGKPCGRIVAGWRPASRAAERAGLVLPGHLLDAMAP